MVLKRTLSIAKEPEVDDQEEELEKFKVIGPTPAYSTTSVDFVLLYY